MEKIILIPDEAINLLENDLLGTKTYVEVLRRIIEDCKTPYTIGLFGSWGSGKTSIIRTLKETITNDKEIAIYIYDAWKYSRDDFRRTFILGLAEFFDEKSIVKELKENFYTTISKNTTCGISKIINFNKTITTTRPQILFPEYFEDKFKDLIKKLNIKKVIISIDNIDRCDKQQVLEILLTIKTFMEIEKVVFIIPIDEIGLRKFLAMSQNDADEFLRKIFNTSIKIKNFSESELYDYGMQLIKKYNIELPEKETVISLVCQEFTKNPRKIIQFFNILQTEFYLAEMQEKNNLIPKESVTSNIEALVKILIIREHYPDIYEKILDNKNLIQEIHQGIKENKFEKNAEGNWIYEDFNIKLNENEYRFFMRTLNIEIFPDKLELFLVNKDTFKEIPDELYLYIISQDWSEIRGLMAKQNIEIDKILKFMDYIANEEVIKRKLYKTTGYNLLSLLFKIIAEKKEKVEPLPQHLKALLNINELWKQDYLFKYPLQEMCETAKYLYNKEERIVADNIINSINNITVESIKKDINVTDLIKWFILSFKDKPEIFEKIKAKFSELLSSDFTLSEQFNEVIDSEIIKDLLSDDFVEKVIPTLNQNFNVNQTKDKIELIKKLNLSDKTINVLCDTCIRFLGLLQNYYDWNIFNFWLEAINNFISGKLTDASKQNIYTAITNNTNFILQNYNNSNFNQPIVQTYKEFISLIGNFYLICHQDTQRQNLFNYLNQFFINRNREVFEHTIGVFEQMVIKMENWPFADVVIQKYSSEQDVNLKNKLAQIMTLMIKKTRKDKGLDDKKTQQIISLFFDEIFNKNNTTVEEWLINLYSKNKITQEPIHNYLQNNLDKIELNKVQKLLYKIPFEIYYKKIKELLASIDINQQKKGIDILHNLLQQNLLNSVDTNKLHTLTNLINDLKANKFDEEYTTKIEGIKDKINRFKK